MTTHADLHAAVSTLVSGLTIGVALRVSTRSDVAELSATELGAHVVCVAVDESPGDDRGGMRYYMLTLSAGRLIGCNEAAARSAVSALARGLRTAVQAQNALGSVGTQVVRAESDDITTAAGYIALRQRYIMIAPS